VQTPSEDSSGLKLLSKHENFTGPTPLSIFFKYALSGAFIWRVVAFIYAGFGLAFSESTPYVLVRACAQPSFGILKPVTVTLLHIAEYKFCWWFCQGGGDAVKCYYVDKTRVEVC